MTETAFRHWLADDVETFGSQKEAARVYRISASYLSDILKGKREPGQKLLDELGFRRVVSYEKVETE